MMTGLAIAAALALAKDQLIDKPAEARKRKLAAETERGSPWTGLHGQLPNESNTLGTVMQGAAVGAQMGQGYENAQANNRYRDAMTARLNSGGSLGGGWGGGYGKDFTANSLGGEDYAKALSAKDLGSSSWGKPAATTDPYQSLYDADVNPDAQYFKGSPWYTR